MSTLSEIVSYSSMNNPAKFYAFHKKYTISFFTPYPSIKYGRNVFETNFDT